VRDLKILNIKGKQVIAVAKNNDNLQLYNINRRP
jgi:hypothetical protein